MNVTEFAKLKKSKGSHGETEVMANEEIEKMLDNSSAVYLDATHAEFELPKIS